MIRFWCAVFLGLLAVHSATAQSSTSSALSGFVFDTSGVPLANARVEVLHEPTGTLQTVFSRANGRFQLAGLRPGGPYLVTVDAAGFVPQQRGELFLALGSEQRLDFALRLDGDDDIILLDDFAVVASDSGLLFSDLAQGPAPLLMKPICGCCQLSPAP